MDSGKKNLLDPAFLKKLELLKIQARRAFAGTMRGERRSTRRGASVEFADFRKYEAGDDFRHVDWNIYARLERLMLRQFVEEEDVRIDILLDQSGSMHFGNPITKFDFAVRAAAALSFLAVSGLDRVGISTFDSAARIRLRAMRGRGHLLAALSFLGNLSEEFSSNSMACGISENVRTEEGENVPEPTNLAAVLRSYQKSTSRAGILFIISDFLDTGDFQKEMKMLAHRGFDVNLLQVLAPEEINPELGGDLLVIDAETGEEREITVNDRALAAYKASLSRFTDSLESFCRGCGLGYLMVTADTAFEDTLLKNLIESRMAG